MCLENHSYGSDLYSNDIYAARALFQQEMVGHAKKFISWKYDMVRSYLRNLPIKFCGNFAELANFRRERDERNANLWRAAYIVFLRPARTLMVAWL